MTKKMKVRIGYLVCMVLCMIISMQINVLAAKSDKITKRDYAIEELQDYLGGFGYSNSDDIKLSQKYNIQNTDGNSIFFVNINEEQVGAIIVTEVDGDRDAVFLYGEFDDIVPYDKEIAVKSDDGEMAIVYDDVEKIISGENAGEIIPSENEDISVKKIKYTDENEKVNIKADKYESLVDESLVTNDYNAGSVAVGSSQKTAAQIANVPTTILYHMNIVNFRENYSINGGICWAASGASIINYKLNTNYSTLDVFNTLSNVYGVTPVGSIEWKQRMWSYYGVPMTLAQHRLSFNTVVQKLGSRCPIFCDFFLSTDGVTLTQGHSVVLCGCYYRTDLQKYYYVYMDPNYAPLNVYIVNHIPEYVLNSEVGTGFYYNPGSGTVLNNWVNAFY